MWASCRYIFCAPHETKSLATPTPTSTLHCRPQSAHADAHFVVFGIGPLLKAATGKKNLGAAWWQSFAAQLVSAVPDARLLEIIPLAGGSVLEHRWPTYYSTNVRRMAAVISGISRFVAADCGVMHLACAAGAPTVGLFHGTEIMEWGPYGSRDLAFDVASMPPEAVANVLAALQHQTVHGS